MNNAQNSAKSLRGNFTEWGDAVDDSRKEILVFLLDRGIIVSTAGARNESKKTSRSRWYNTISDVPIIILVNSGSASASEIVAAALKQNNRALIIGRTTFGKGSVQQLRQFKDGSAIKMTISKYLTPNNNSIQSIGVSPHIELNPLIVSKDLVQIVNNAQNSAKSLRGNFTECREMQ